MTCVARSPTRKCSALRSETSNERGLYPDSYFFRPNAVNQCTPRTRLQWKVTTRTGDVCGVFSNDEEVLCSSERDDEQRARVVPRLVFLPAERGPTTQEWVDFAAVGGFRPLDFCPQDTGEAIVHLIVRHMGALGSFTSRNTRV